MAQSKPDYLFSYMTNMFQMEPAILAAVLNQRHPNIAELMDMVHQEKSDTRGHNLLRTLYIPRVAPRSFRKLVDKRIRNGSASDESSDSAVPSSVALVTPLNIWDLCEYRTGTIPESTQAVRRTYQSILSTSLVLKKPPTTTVTPVDFTPLWAKASRSWVRGASNLLGSLSISGPIGAGKTTAFYMYIEHEIRAGRMCPEPLDWSKHSGALGHVDYITAYLPTNSLEPVLLYVTDFQKFIENYMRVNFEAKCLNALNFYRDVLIQLSEAVERLGDRKFIIIWDRTLLLDALVFQDLQREVSTDVYASWFSSFFEPFFEQLCASAPSVTLIATPTFFDEIREANIIMQRIRHRGREFEQGLPVKFANDFLVKMLAVAGAKNLPCALFTPMHTADGTDLGVAVLKGFIELMKFSPPFWQATESVYADGDVVISYLLEMMAKYRSSGGGSKLDYPRIVSVLEDWAEKLIN